MRLKNHAGLLLLSLGLMAGCASGAKPFTIVAPGDATHSGAPVSGGKSSGDEIIAPKAETPPAPTTPTDPTTPPPLPTPPKAPETPTGPKEGDKSAEAAPSPPSGIIMYVPPSDEPMTGPSYVSGVKVDDPDSIVTPESFGGTTADVQSYRCPAGQVVTGFEYSTVSIDPGCGEGSYGSFDSGGCAPDVHMGGFKLLCSPLSLSGTDVTKSVEAVSFPTGGSVAGKADAVMDSDPAKTSCKPGTGIATGFFGRADGELRSFGLFCGYFHAWKDGVAIIPTYNKTASAEDWGGDEYAASPGWEGSTFEKSCDTNQSVVGLYVGSSADHPLGIRGVLCSDVKPVFAKPLFGTGK